MSVETLTNEIKKKGIRPSYQRIKVLEYLHQLNAHPTADEVFQALVPEIPTLSKTTVYNTLHAFVDAGLVRVVNIDEIELRYDIMLSNHGHFKCEACGMIINFDIDIDSFPTNGLQEFQVNERNVYFTGLCPNCSVSLHPKE
ncbi:MAG: Fur family transcriptional regulator [Salinivirgaceae bacterium]|nr:Fur family transcriptional regulator [Salinivirgaceae bacterium]